MTKDLIKYINEKAAIELLQSLVRIHSPYFHEEEIMKFVFAWLEKRNLLPEIHKYSDDKITKFNGLNIVGKLKGNAEGPRILLNGHLDTVNICEGWTKDPLKAELEDGKLYGVGSLDMKGGVTALLLALEAFKNTVGDFKGEIVYTFVSDEEGPYGLGTNALIVDGIVQDIDAAIVAEPSSGFCGIEFPCLCLGARGGMGYTVYFKGKSAHAANPEKGISAILDCAKVMLELKNTKLVQDTELGNGSICIIECGGGGQACSVADTAYFKVFRHVVRGEDTDYLKEEIKSAVKRANIESEVTIHFRDAPNPEAQGFEPYIVDKNNSFTIEMMNCIKENANGNLNLSYFSSIGDFNYIGSRLNAPTFVIGPDGENYHAKDEYVNIDSVVKTSKIIYDFLVKVSRK